MPQRILKPAWQGIKSPITLKTLLLFLTISFIAYTIVRDEQQRQASFERFKMIAKYTEESRVALEAAKVQSERADDANKNTLAMLDYMGELNRNMHEVAEILRINRERQRTEHEMIINRPAQMKKPVRLPRTCYELRPVKKKFGDSEVTTSEYVKIPCT